jgi:hypothetical protein
MFCGIWRIKTGVLNSAIDLRTQMGRWTKRNDVLVFIFTVENTNTVSTFCSYWESNHDLPFVRSNWAVRIPKARIFLTYFTVHAVAQWLKHCPTNRKVAGSIPGGVNGIFHWHNPFGRTMALGSTQPLIEMSTRNISWGKRRSVGRADNLTTFMCRLS